MMKEINNIKKIIDALKSEIESKYKAKVLGLFGSYARGEQKDKSDIDILVTFKENATLFDFVGLAIFLEEKLGMKVDIVPQDAIREEIKDNIMNEVIYI